MRRHPTGPAAPAHDRPRARVAAAECDAEARSRFLRALRGPRPVARLDGAVTDDPLTTALSRFTGTA